MILIDTNILIDLYDLSSPEISSVFQNSDIALCGIAQAEFLHGTKSDAEVAWMQELVGSLEYIDISHSDWESIGLFLRTLREHGLSVPFTDAVIAYLAIKHDCKVWTNDKHFELIQKVMPRLALFHVLG